MMLSKKIREYLPYDETFSLSLGSELFLQISNRGSDHF